ncbi:TPA: helix-turn-helix transcriptional regulator [Yersinia enterocolitica]|nr:helix-turn-helix transcriptional regulator [Yersinia enterocolitica]
MSIGLGEKIKLIRESERLSQKEMSDLTGIPYGTFIHYEQGRSKPGADAIIRMLKVSKFRKYRDWFMFDEVNPAAGQIAPALSLGGPEATTLPPSETKIG